MTADQAPTLSEHLLREAAKFLFYPRRVRRTRMNMAVQNGFDQLRRQLVEFRKTFAPKGDVAFVEGSNLMTSPVMLDELYSRDLLREVPQIVERTRSLSQMSLSNISQRESFIYLREAANCYIFGLPQAAVALARAAIEAPLRVAASKQFGAAVIGEAGLFKIIDDYAVRGKLLSRTGLSLAHKVRIAADTVLHERATTTDDALEIIEAARAVILELEAKQPATPAR
jgi:hypothetical protein